VRAVTTGYNTEGRELLRAASCELRAATPASSPRKQLGLSQELGLFSGRLSIKSIKLAHSGHSMLGGNEYAIPDSKSQTT
jgi:hypothetical protein